MTQHVHLRINDAATAKPTPVRLRVTGADGRYYAPLGRLTEFATGPNEDVGGNVLIDGQPWAYVDGACEIRLPPGELHIQAAKGLEYRPLDARVQLIAGKLSLRLEIERWTDARADGWRPGDARAHFIPPHAALLEAAAEDLEVVNLLIRETAAPAAAGMPRLAIPNLDAFSGQAPCLTRPGHLIAVNTENYHPLLGSLGLLHCHRVVYPLSMGKDEPNDDTAWTLHDWCGQCHRKNGLVVWTRTLHETPHFRHGEPLIDALLGAVDAFEITPETWESLELWYDLLNVGLRLPLAGSSGKDKSAGVLGAVRTYVHQAEAPTYQDWIEGLRAGRSYATAGPLLNLAVNGCLPGTTVNAPAGRVHVSAGVRGLALDGALELIHDGHVVSVAAVTTQSNAEEDTSPVEAAIQQDLLVERSGWLAVRFAGPRAILAHTSPVYIDVPDRPAPHDGDAARRLSYEIERIFAWATAQKQPLPCPKDDIKRLLLDRKEPRTK